MYVVLNHISLSTAGHIKVKDITCLSHRQRVWKADSYWIPVPSENLCDSLYLYFYLYLSQRLLMIKCIPARACLENYKCQEIVMLGINVNLTPGFQNSSTLYVGGLERSGFVSLLSNFWDIWEQMAANKIYWWAKQASFSQCFSVTQCHFDASKVLFFTNAFF